MMKIQLEGTGVQNRIRSATAGQVTINQQVYTRSLIVTPETIVPDWAPPSFDLLAAEHFEAVLALRPEVLLLGTGARLRFPHPALTAGLMQARVGFEVMDTAAACRTFNVLLADGRRVVAALLMIESGSGLR